MLPQSSSASKGAKAALAGKGLLASMHPHVAFEITSGLEVFLTFVALKRRLSTVASHVNRKVALLVETLRTTLDVALERPLARVDAGVSCKATLVLETC